MFKKGLAGFGLNLHNKVGATIAINIITIKHIAVILCCYAHYLRIYLFIIFISHLLPPQDGSQQSNV